MRILPVFLCVFLVSCSKDPQACKDISKMEATYSGVYDYYSSGYEVVIDSAGSTYLDGYFQETDSGAGTITITQVAGKKCILSFTGSGPMADAFKGYAELEYEWDDDLIYNNSLELTEDTRNFSLRFEADYLSLEFDWGRSYSPMLSTTTLHFEGAK
ncbi:MAG: hypothetical protein KDC34_05050 [Saprospiraceae bacterium]|nr:hypothetical protein [Saprospiraceae bacterium]